jgi:hypothetical protein
MLGANRDDRGDENEYRRRIAQLQQFLQRESGEED